MMSRVRKAGNWHAAVSPLKAGAASFVMLMMPLGPVVADPQGTVGWGTNVETEAESAYRAIYQRSLATGANQPVQRPDANAPARTAPQPRAQPPKRAQAEPRQPVGAALPDLPVRNPAALAAQAAVSQPASQGTPAKAAANAAPPAEPRTVASTATAQPAPLPLAAAQRAEPPASDPWAEPVFARAANDDDLVTAVLGSDEPGDVRDRAPRDRGDQYCTNIANAATDARFVWQRQALRETEEQVKKRIEELQLQIADYKKWLARREEFSKRAQSAITDIYAKMAPDAAAAQLTVLDEETAAAVIAKLNPRVASAVMAEMDATRAARLTAIIAASSKGPKGKPPANPRGQGT